MHIFHAQNADRNKIKNSKSLSARLVILTNAGIGVFGVLMVCSVLESFGCCVRRKAAPRVEPDKECNAR